MSQARSIEGAEFRKALSTFTTGVTVVTTLGQQAEDIGLTANSFNSVSLDPPLVLWSLAKSSLSLEAFKAAEFFAVHILASDQEELSGRFAKRGVDKFAGLELQRGRGDIPLLSGCAAIFQCRTAYQYEGGDHIIFVGEVVEFDRWEQAPLLFHGGQYGQLLKASATNGVEDAPADEENLNRDFLGDLLRRAYRQIYRPVREEYERRSITIPQYFFISRVAQQDKPNIDDIKRRLQVEGRCPTDAEIQNLVDRGLVEVQDNHVHLTREGVKLNVELVTLVSSTEADAERGLDYELRETLKMALEQLIRSTSAGEK